MSTDAHSIYTPPTGNSWRQATSEVLANLRAALQRAIGYAAGTGQRSRDVQKRFGVSFQLSWEIYNLVAEGNVLNCAPNVPIPSGMKRLFSNMREKGIPEADVAAAEAAYEAFNAHVVDVAGDRTTYNAIMSRLIGGETDSQNELVHREASFEAQRYVMGAEQAVHAICHIVHPNADNPKNIDTIRLVNRHRIMRLNYGKPFKLDTSYANTMTDVSGMVFRPLNIAAAEKYGVNILPEFCSHPDLPLRPVHVDNKHVVEWGIEELGARGAINFAMGSVTLNSSLRMRDNLYGVEMRTITSTAVRRVIYDFFTHRPSYRITDIATKRFARVFDMPDSAIDMDSTQYVRLPMYEQIEFMGSGTSSAYLAGISDYTRMLEYACNEMKWNITEFDHYRLTVDYPFMDSLVARIFHFTHINA